MNGREQGALATVAERERTLAGLRRMSALTEGLGEGVLTLLVGLHARRGNRARDGCRGRRRDAGGAAPGMLVLLALASFEAIRPLPAAAQQLAATEAAAARLYEVTHREPAVHASQIPAARPAGEELRADGVTVRLRSGGPPAPRRRRPDGSPRPGDCAVGPSGAGKTTLAHLLVRFRDPDAGRVELDGRDLRAYGQDDVRAAVLLSDQDGAPVRNDDPREPAARAARRHRARAPRRTPFGGGARRARSPRRPRHLRRPGGHPRLGR